MTVSISFLILFFVDNLSRVVETTKAIQAKADLIYTWQRLTFAGYEEFWYASTDDSAVPTTAILANGPHFWYSIVATVVAMALYWFLIGGKFWEKY
jgi:hypothetical protein